MKKKLVMLLVVYSVLTGLFFMIGPPQPIFRLLMEIPQYREWMIREMQQVGLTRLFFDPVGAGTQIGSNMRFWTIIMCSGVVSIIPFIIIIALSKKQCKLKKGKV